MSDPGPGLEEYAEKAHRPDLGAFFANRTIGYSSMIQDWTWRGQGYDEGWVTPTRAELAELHRLLGAWLGEP